MSQLTSAEVKSMIEKVSVISENALLIMNRLLGNMGVKGISVEGSEENEEHAIGNCKKEILVIWWQRIWLNCVL